MSSKPIEIHERSDKMWWIWSEDKWQGPHSSQLDAEAAAVRKVA